MQGVQLVSTLWWQYSYVQFAGATVVVNKAVYTDTVGGGVTDTLLLNILWTVSAPSYGG